MTKSIEIFEKKGARPLMVQGTSSHVGKSIIAAALCRIFKDRGLKVAPFKAQNMALNSSVTPDGGEIGRAQAFQAEAAGVVPTVDMNPVLLKPAGDSVSQVIIHGRVYGQMSAIRYHGFKKEAKRYILESYERLSAEYDCIVIEGAGSPAEVNLRENDVANMGIAEMAKSPVVLVGDIDRGGVFASLVGTLELLTPGERGLVKGFIINKFRGDIELLRPGLEFLSNRTGLPVLGVVPYVSGFVLPDEDGVSLDRGGNGFSAAAVNIAVVRLPRISNFTDFDPFRRDPSIRLDFITDPRRIAGADMAIIPGTKNTLEDLAWLKENGFAGALADFVKRGGLLFGVCGGFQMLGSSVKDPLGVESGKKYEEGLGLIDAQTTLTGEKKTYTVEAGVRFAGRAFTVKGYEIHMGETVTKAAPFGVIGARNGQAADVKDGAVSSDFKVAGTYIHGIFDNDGFRTFIIDGLRAGKGLGPSGDRFFEKEKEGYISALAATVEKSVDMEALLRITGLSVKC